MWFTFKILVHKSKTKAKVTNYELVKKKKKETPNTQFWRNSSKICARTRDFKIALSYLRNKMLSLVHVRSSTWKITYLLYSWSSVPFSLSVWIGSKTLICVQSNNKNSSWCPTFKPRVANAYKRSKYIRYKKRPLSFFGGTTALFS